MANELKPFGPVTSAWNTSPAAPVDGLETVLERPYLGSLVARSQAEAIIAAKDKKYADTEAAHKTLIDVKNSIIEGLAKNLFVFAQDTGSSMAALEADNAALTARVKELGEDRDSWRRVSERLERDSVRQATEKEALETQLAAARNVLSVFLSEYDALYLFCDEPPSMVSAVEAARAALEERP